MQSQFQARKCGTWPKPSFPNKLFSNRWWWWRWRWYPSPDFSAGGGGGVGYRHTTAELFAGGTFAVVIGAGGTGRHVSTCTGCGSASSFDASGSLALSTTGGGSGGSIHTQVPSIIEDQPKRWIWWWIF